MVTAKPDDDLTADNFDWPDECIAVREQQRIAVYWNVQGDAVVRQEAADSYYSDDAIVVINADRVAAVAAALLDLIGQRLPAEREIAAPPTAPLTNAERQRRYRQQHRNEKRNPALRDVTQDAELFPNRKEETTP